MDRKKQMIKNMYPLSIFKKDSKQEPTQFLPSFFFLIRKKREKKCGHRKSVLTMADWSGIVDYKKRKVKCNGRGRRLVE